MLQLICRLSTGIGIPVILHFLKLTFPGIYFWKKEKKDNLEGIIDRSGEPLANNNINHTNPQGNV